MYATTPGPSKGLNTFASSSLLHGIAAVCNIITCIFTLTILILLLTEGITIKETIREICQAGDINPNRIGKFVNMTYDIVANVDKTTEDAVPIMQAARRSVENTTITSNETTAFFDGIVNATSSIASIGSTQWKQLFGNTTKLIGGFAAMNFTKITDLIGDLHDPTTQKVVRERVDHALRSFDFASLGLSHLMGTFSRVMKNEESTQPEKWNDELREGNTHPA